MSSVNIQIVINGPAATSVTFAPVSPEPVAPVAVGTVVGTLTILPAGWSGAVALSGTDAASFALGAISSSGTAQLTAAVSLSAKTYNLTATATP